GNMSINSNSLSVVGGSEDAPDTGIKQTFGLGAITSNFNLEFDWIMPSNGESQWIHYVNIGSTSMSNSNRTSNVGLGIYYGESGDYFSPNGTENISNDLTGNMENNVSGGPFTIRLEVDTAANDYDYYRDGILRAAGQNWVNSGASMSQIRIATEKYSSAAFTYDNLRIYLTVAASPTIASSSEESQIGTVESGYPSDNFSMSGNKGLWHLDEASGTITDSSGLGNDGTLSGGSYGAAGRLATALDFNGTSDFVAVPDSASLDITNNLTVSFWVYADTTPQLWDSPIIKTTDDDSWYDGFGMFYQGGQIRFWVDQYDTNVASAAFSVGSWHHVVGTYDGTTVRVYVDGVEGTPDSYTGSITPNNTSLFIGSGADASGAGYYWDGKIDEVAVFDRAIDSSEVQALYKRGALNLRYQVRSCDDLACSGESFIGPDGTGSSYYSEITNTALTPPDQVLTNVADNRFFQYQVVLETLDSALSPELKSVTIGYSGGGFVGFSLSGSLVSSAFDMGDVSPVQIIEWDETIPSCSPSCSVQFQLRTAPDASGSPGTWTNWYGATGMGTYFTSANGTRIPVELNGNQWLQYRVELAGDGAETPVLEEIRTFYR
ncbi:LamG domain-containing protein, partial [Candidatus Berkelbacteria bacterium]|nr:LamG domain-containing protein [Candidatus Berkelbacteria bacterium]